MLMRDFSHKYEKKGVFMPATATLPAATDAIWSVLQHADPGHRCILSGAPTPDLNSLCRSLQQASRVLLITGFPVLHGGGAAETDGPAGVAALAYALQAIGAEPHVVTDENCREVVTAACRDAVPGIPVHAIPADGGAEACHRLLEALQPSHIIALERPGMAADGHYYNFRGKTIDHLLGDTHTLFTDTDAVTVAIGDGGNELGMGAIVDAVCATAPMGELVCAREPADYTLVAGVSNWWGWGLAAALSAETGKDLLPTDADELRRARLVMEAGAVDGVLGTPQMMVDGLSMEQNLEILHALRAAVGL